MAGAKIGFGSGATELTGTADGYAKVALANTDQPDSIGGVRLLSENDDGVGLAADPQLWSPETDLDYRMRVGLDTMLEDETFCTTAQNTGKFQYYNTTMTNAWATTGMTTNSGATTTVNTGTVFRSYAYYPCFGTTTTSADIEIAFSSWNVSNTIIDFGLGLTPATPSFASSAASAPTDGAYFRVSSAGIIGVINSSGSETTTSAFSWTPTVNKKYQFIIYVHHRVVEFWINDGETTRLYGLLNTPSGQGQPHAAGSLPLFIRHVITGGTAGASQTSQLSNWNVRVGGFNFARTFGEIGNSIHGSHQGLSGGTMGSLANFANSANPSPAAPTNTTAALGTGLGGQFWETDTLAANTDGVICSYQVPAGSVNQPARRLRLNGVTVQSFVQTVLTGGGYNAVWSLAFGHTAVSLATGEAATTKAPRRVPMGVQSVASAAAALTVLQTITLSLKDPIYVNPGEFVAVVKKKVGTAPSAGTIAHIITMDYAWE